MFDENKTTRGFILLYQFNLFAEKCETSEIIVLRGNFISLQPLH